MDSEMALGPLELVHTALMRAGFTPSIIQAQEHSPSIIHAAVHGETGGIGAAHLTCAESQPGEVVFVLNATVGELDTQQFVDLLRFINNAHSEAQIPGCLFLDTQDPDDPEWFLVMRFLLRVSGDELQAMDIIEETIVELEDCFRQCKWAAYQILTGDSMEDALNTLEIGWTMGTA